MDKKMENAMEAGVMKGLYRDPSTQIQVAPTLGSKVCKYSYVGLFGCVRVRDGMRYPKP